MKSNHKVPTGMNLFKKVKASLKKNMPAAESAIKGTAGKDAQMRINRE